MAAFANDLRSRFADWNREAVIKDKKFAEPMVCALSQAIFDDATRELIDIFKTFFLEKC